MQLKVFAYSVFYVFFEQYLHIWNTAAITLLAAAGAIAVVCWLFSGR